ncbi:MAG: hypothetical protein ACYC9S_09270 [Leptospirales bacterium]
MVQTLKTFRSLDSWIHHRLRAVQLKHWRRGPRIYRGLRNLGASHELGVLVAGGGSRWWHHSQSGLNKVLTVSYFDSLGVPQLHDFNFSNRPVRTRMPGGVAVARLDRPLCRPTEPSALLLRCGFTFQARMHPTYLQRLYSF